MHTIPEEDEDDLLEDTSDADDQDCHKCPTGLDEWGNRFLTVVDVKGVCFLRAAWCRCLNAPSQRDQLLDARLWPSSQRRPQTVFSFSFLRQTQIETLTCKTSIGRLWKKAKRTTSFFEPNRVIVSVIQCAKKLSDGILFR